MSCVCAYKMRHANGHACIRGAFLCQVVVALRAKRMRLQRNGFMQGMHMDVDIYVLMSARVERTCVVS